MYMYRKSDYNMVCLSVWISLDVLKLRLVKDFINALLNYLFVFWTLSYLRCKKKNTYL